MPRLFIGLSLEPNVKDTLAQQQDYFKLVLDETWFRFTLREQQHLTLIFLDSVAANNVDLVKQAIRFSCRQQQAFSLATTSLGAFPSAHRPSVLWTGIQDKQDQLQQLYQNLNTQLEGLYKAEQRTYRPHLTLARVKRFGQNESISHALATAPNYPSATWELNAIHLYSSSTNNDGSSQQIIFTHPFKKALQ